MDEDECPCLAPIAYRFGLALKCCGTVLDALLNTIYFVSVHTIEIFYLGKGEINSVHHEVLTVKVGLKHIIMKSQN